MLRFDTSAPRDWERIEQITARLSQFVDRHGIEPAHSILVVGTELLENAVKYGAPDSAIGLSLSVGEGKAVRVTSGLDGGWVGRKRLERLRAELSWLASFDDPRHAFVARLQEIYDGEPCEGGLGLARIAGEGPCRLGCRVDAGRHEIEVVADFLET